MILQVLLYAGVALYLGLTKGDWSGAVFTVGAAVTLYVISQSDNDKGIGPLISHFVLPMIIGTALAYRLYV